MQKFLMAVALSAAGLAAVPAQATVVGVADTSGAFPFGPNAYLGGYYFQQVYSAASFSSALTISDLTFYTQTVGGAANSGSYTLYLSTTDAAVQNFGTNTTTPYNDPSFTQVFQGTLGTIVDGKLTLDLATAFQYDPTAGNLLLTVLNSSLSSDGTACFDADMNVGVSDWRFSAYSYESSRGLVTGFNEGTSAVPEPATWAMMIGGFGMVGAALRRRQRVTIRFA